MPNHVTNRITAEKSVIDQIFLDDEVDFNRFIPQPESLQTDEIHSGIKCIAEITMGLVDLGKPPKMLSDNDPKALPIIANALHYEAVHRTLVENKMANTLSDEEFDQLIDTLISVKKTGCMSWYEWNTENWGTKWGAYSAKRESANKVIFETAWSPPHPVIQAIVNKYDCELLHEWADEDTGNNCGFVSYKPSEGSEITELSASREGYELAFSLTGGKEYYRFNENIDNYEYFDPDEEDEAVA